LTIGSVISAFQIIFYTYFYGYHTLQQIFLGLILALGSVDITVFLHYEYTQIIM
jgi:hypothetical protein